jgi:superfamily II DNA/RNA helicase
VHRIGRTGRAGRSGTAITLVAGSNDAKAVAAIEKLIGQPIPWMGQVPGTAPAPRHAASGSRQEKREETRQEKSHGTPQGTHRRRRPDGHRQPRPAASASIARIPQRPPQPRSPQPTNSRPDDGDASHLPAFLLRPVPLKA